MRNEISVIVFRPKGREYFQAQWVDPVTGLKKTRSTKKKIRRDAERFAAVLQRELNEGKYKHPSAVTWEEFRERYEADVLPGLAKKTQSKVDTVFNSIERLIKPTRIVSLDAEQISRNSRLMREAKLSESTIKSNLGHLRAALRWAHGQKLLHELPRFVMPTRTNKATKRAVTTEEFERMLLVTAKVVGEDQADSWRFFLRGLWWSGLRLGEAVSLTWDDPSTLCLILDGRRPLLSIPPDGQKSGRATLWPIPPEFYELLMTVPVEERTGRVFPLWSNKYLTPRLTTYHTVGDLVGKIGKAAGVKTSGKGFATAHDLRRSFGVRWSRRVTSAVLQKLMRHASISTTLSFYVREDAVSTADAVWEAAANTLANGDVKPIESQVEQSDETLWRI